MKSATLSALFFAASIALAVAYPARNYYYDDDYPEGKAVLAGRPISLASSPFYYQARTLELEHPRGRKYQIVKKKKKGQSSDEDDAQDDEGSDESSEEDEEEDDENNEPENNEEESLDVPPWEELFPEEDKNTGTFQDQQGPGGEGGYGGGGQGGYGGGGQGGYGGGGQGGPQADLPAGGPAPQSSGGSLFGNLFGGGGGSSFGGSPTGGPLQSDIGGGGGGPPQYRQGPPPPYQPVRARTSMQSAEEPRSGGAVLYDGYRYIPVKPVHVRVPKRQAKKIKPTKKVATDKVQARSLRPAPVTSSSTPRQKKKLSTNKKPKQQYVLVPVQRNNREIRFSRDQHGMKMESGPFFAPTEIWRWEGPGGRPLRRRENRPSGLYYAPRPQRGSSSTIRFAEENDY